jgi:glyoxylase-like metal-dependent hydrolase (beta-lactamase superfamily II)
MRYFIIFSALFLAACTSARPRVSLPISAAITLRPDGSEVGTYVSSWNGFRTSSYWIEGPTGLILIDTQFLLSAGEEFVDWAEKVTGKKAVLAIVLHPNPDKFNGTALFQRRGIKVITSDEVLSLIPAVHKLRLGWFYDRFKPDYPLETPKPDTFGSSTTTVEAAGLKIQLHVLGPGCSGAHVVAQYGEHVFVGDLVTIGFHSWLELGLLDEWLDRLDDIRAMRPKYLHTGRGETGDLSSVDREEDYLRTVIEIVKSHHPHAHKALSAATREKIVDEIQNRYPAYDFPLFLKVDALWKRMGEHSDLF